MISRAILITISCVLFVNMGLSDEIQRILHINFKPLSCPKCLTFWVVSICSFINCLCFLKSIALAFICSYSAMWLTLIYDSLAVLYNEKYEELSKTKDADSETDSDEVS